MGYKDKQRLENYKEVRERFDDCFTDSNAVEKLSYIRNWLNNKIKELENGINSSK